MRRREPLHIEISDHAPDQMAERGAHEDEVRAAIEQGEPEPSRGGRVMYRKNFPFGGRWRERS